MTRGRAPIEEDLTLLARLAGPLTYDDPDLLHLVAHDYLHPPSTLPYQLVKDNQEKRVSASEYYAFEGEFAYVFCKSVLREVFEGAPSGFFVEAGAIDGEFLSNTLYLEREKGWTGLLVEADGDMFELLLKKQRKAWASHSCLATHDHPHRDTLVKYVNQMQSLRNFHNYAARAHGSMMGVSGGATLDRSSPGHAEYESVQCLPLATLLLALNITHVDLISLDVEGAEVGILRYFPWQRITVDVWLVEHAPPSASIHSSSFYNNKTLASPDNPRHNQERSLPSKPPEQQSYVSQEFVDMFNEHGYDLYRVSSELFNPNYLFILRNSEHHERLNMR